MLNKDIVFESDDDFCMNSYNVSYVQSSPFVTFRNYIFIIHWDILAGLIGAHLLLIEQSLQINLTN